VTFSRVLPTCNGAGRYTKLPNRQPAASTPKARRASKAMEEEGFTRAKVHTKVQHYSYIPVPTCTSPKPGLTHYSTPKVNMINNSKFIDNTQNFYVPIRLKCGVTLQCHPQLFEANPKIIQILDADIAECIQILPPSIRNLIRRIQIWVNVTYTYGAIDDPRILKHTTAHHHRQWLVTVNDIPAKALGIEIYNCFEYEQMRLHWNGCGLILHELCHLIHQLVLTDGLDSEMVMDSFGNALESGFYDDVLRRDWAYMKCDRDAAYATINHKEFFSELSVAFLSRDYEYNVRDGYGSVGNLNQHMDICSPPIMAPDVYQRGMEVGKEMGSNQSWMERLRNVLRGRRRGHCNKFFPFTRGQLKRFDPHTFAVFQQLWAEIADWDDPLEQSNTSECKGCVSFPLPCLRPSDYKGGKMSLNKTLLDDSTSMDSVTEQGDALFPDSVDL